MGGLPHPAAAQAVADAAAPSRVNFVCVNVGPKYPMSYVEILRDMVLRNSSNMDHDCAFWCVTDRADELPEGVYAIPADPALPGWWQKVRLFSPSMPWAQGDRCVYFDLDVAITGRLEDLVERKGIMDDPHWPMRNSSVMVWDHGEHGQIWYNFTADEIAREAEPEIKALLPRGQINAGDQHWITKCAPDWPTFPRDWFVSYRAARDWPPNECKAVIFHGSPKPAEVTDGWVPNIWRVGGFTSFPEIKGVNTSEEQRLANVEVNSKRDLDWFTGFRNEGRSCVIVCGSPSMKDYLPEIRAHRRRGARIVSVNNAWRFLHQRGITPDVNVMLDARPQNAEFLNGAPKAMRWMIASQCDPSVFDLAAELGLETVLWHNGYDSGYDRLWEMLEPYRDSKPVILVPGGSTVGLRTMWLAAFSGFRTLHMYGIDSSFADDGAHHAYAQALNDHDEALEVAMGEKRYLCARWMIRQANEFQGTWRDLKVFAPMPDKIEPVTVHVKGRGLIPDIARKLREEERAA
ncbi:6-hydroxymethylpterin diphosphokinase MptE-like protein [Phenylobacterium soli]|uniref:6-hydroxymethylpterin diphosphokinase MptE-like domain-containing protein n=1 Tax=Phenylobacterium soli TaxID=2170551 RepID=A0A328A9B4_9CAUL|nr:6-hydroxymethylpterin diphosphokinase MptE-like protein [Phenylobacterium soli]RAK51200.1 hypothetical protein DJ017_19775 [Phenylobacterium soli]